MNTDNEALKLAEKCGVEVVEWRTHLHDMYSPHWAFKQQQLEAFYNEAIQTGRDQKQRELAKLSATSPLPANQRNKP